MEPNISTFIYIFYVHLCFIHIQISNSSRIGFFIQICLSGRCTWLLHPILWTIFSYTLFFLIMTTFVILRQFQQFGIFAYNFSNSLETNFIFFQLSNYRISVNSLQISQHSYDNLTSLYISVTSPIWRSQSDIQLIHSTNSISSQSSQTLQLKCNLHSNFDIQKSISST